MHDTIAQHINDISTLLHDKNLHARVEIAITSSGADVYVRIKDHCIAIPIYHRCGLSLEENLVLAYDFIEEGGLDHYNGDNEIPF